MILLVGCFCIFILTNLVSQEMALEAALISHLDARRKAEEKSNYKSQFLANMSHDLRTPMAAVIGLLDILMSDKCFTAEQQSMITQIRKCSSTSLRLLNNILDLSKVESGKLVLEETEFDLGLELEGLLDMFSVQCINHNVETALDLSDEIPKVVLGDSTRVLQIFANLISNSIKFTNSGYIVLRGWCETETDNKANGGSLHPKESWCAQDLKGSHRKLCSKKDDKMLLWFEVDDTGYGIDPNKWESVFESFEQADPSTTRLHGGTGLGLCIVRNLVNIMNGEIKVVKKSGPGTLMQLHMRLSTPAETIKQHCQFNFEDHNLIVLLAINGRMTRSIMTQWLQQKRVHTHEASDWNELTLCLQELFKAGNHTRETNLGTIITSVFIIIIDIGLLELSTELWRQQLNFLDKYCTSNVGWILNHDTSNVVKAELRERGYPLMVNRPLYKAKVIQIFEAVIKGDRMLNLQTSNADGQFREFLEIDALQSGSVSSDDSEKPKNDSSTIVRGFPGKDVSNTTHPMQVRVKKQCSPKSNHEDQGAQCSSKVVNEQKPLDGLCILLAEDTPVLQRIAKIMLEKMGAKVVVVGDGVQAVDALKDKIQSNGYERLEDTHVESLPYDLILMDCQMPKMDGYEATKAIRRSECGSGLHIPIVALTAHAMSSDEAKCLDVGMDAYLTKPIDCKLMVSTILSLTKETTKK